MINRAKFTINGTPAEDPATGDRLYVGTSDQMLTLTLETNPSDAKSVMYEVFSSGAPNSPLASKDAPEILFDGSGLYNQIFDNPNATASIRLPAFGPTPGVVSYNIRCTAHFDTGEEVFTRQVAILSNNLPPLKKTVPSETNEALARGFSDVIDDIIDALHTLVVESGVQSIASDSNPALTGNVTLSSGNYINLVQVGQDIRFDLAQHAVWHQNGGGDEINVEGLSGLLADPQNAGWLVGVPLNNANLADGYVYAYDAGEGEFRLVPQGGSGGCLWHEPSPGMITPLIGGVRISAAEYVYELSGHDDIPLWNDAAQWTAYESVFGTEYPILLALIDAKNEGITPSFSVMGGYAPGAEYPTSCCVSGSYLFITYADSNALHIVDFSEPGTPIAVGTLVDAVNLVGPWSVTVAGRFAYVACRSGASLQVIDISNPSSPQRVDGIVDAVELAGAMSVHVEGRYAYVACADRNALQIIDISDPGNNSPVIVGSLVDAVNLANAQCVHVQGAYAYVACVDSDSLQIVAVSDPTAPTRVGGLADPVDLDGMARVVVRGKYAYVTCPNGNTFAIINIADPTSPVLAGWIAGSSELEGAMGLVVAGDWAYVACANAGTIRAIDVEHPSAPVLSSESAALNTAFGIALHGQQLFVSSINTDVVLVVSFADNTRCAGGFGSLDAGIVHAADCVLSGDFTVEGGAVVGGDMLVQRSLSVSDDIRSEYFLWDATRNSLGFGIGSYELEAVRSLIFGDGNSVAASVEHCLVAGQSNNVSSCSHSPIFGSNHSVTSSSHINVWGNSCIVDKNFSSAFGAYAKTDWLGGHFFAGERLDAGVIGSSQCILAASLCRRTTTTDQVILRFNDSQTGSPILIEEGYMYAFTCRVLVSREDGNGAEEIVMDVIAWNAPSIGYPSIRTKYFGLTDDTSPYAAENYPRVLGFGCISAIWWTANNPADSDGTIELVVTPNASAPMNWIVNIYGGCKIKSGWAASS